MTKKNKGGRPRDKYPVKLNVKMSFLSIEEYEAFKAASTPRSRVTAVLGGDK